MSEGHPPKIDSSGTKYYHQDQLPNRLVTHSNGNVYAQMGHFPFGESWYNTSGDKLQFTTYERDSESVNDYALAREYVNRLAPFSSPDPLDGTISDPQTLNRYAYARNDPIDFIDPTGMYLDGPGTCETGAGDPCGGGDPTAGSWMEIFWFGPVQATDPNGNPFWIPGTDLSASTQALLGVTFISFDPIPFSPDGAGGGGGGGAGGGKNKYTVNLKVLNKCLSDMGIKTTINSFTPSTPGGYGKAIGKGEDAFSGGGYIVPITVTNDAHTYNAAQVGKLCNLPSALGCTLSVAPYTNYTNNNNAYGTVAAQVWELGNSLWVIQAGSSVIPVPTGKHEPGRILDNCVRAGHGIQAK